jgi:eukaryotic-like serine/threonine-protein kinase
MPLSSGSQFGSYAIIERLGAGGMGEVYRARDIRLERDVALKVLPETLATTDFRRRFLQEAKAAASVAHPNIAHVYEMGDESGTCFIAMEFVEGETLRRIMAESPPRPIPELLGYLQQAAEAIAKAHSRGVVHRDLKPDNIMVTRDGYAKVLDFGLAKLIEKCQEPAAQAAAAPVTETIHPVSTAGFPMGTIGYMSPEQAARG